MSLLVQITMIKKLSKWRRWLSSAGLFAIYSVQGLIHKLAEDTEKVDPLWDPDSKGQVIVHIGKSADDIDDQACQSNQIRRHTLFFKKF